MEWEFSGKNVESAIKNGLRELKLSRGDVEIKILHEGKAGLFGLMGAVPARIKIVSDRRPDLVDWKKASERALELTMMIAGSSEEGVEGDVQRSGRRIHIKLNGGNRALLIGKQGANLRALNYVVNLMMKRDQETRADVLIDVADYTSGKMSEAVSMLEKAVREVRKSGKSFELDPMESPQRKAVHQKAKDFKDIETRSVGDDESRRVIVKKKS